MLQMSLPGDSSDICLIGLPALFPVSLVMEGRGVLMDANIDAQQSANFTGKTEIPGAQAFAFSSNPPDSNESDLARQPSQGSRFALGVLCGFGTTTSPLSTRRTERGGV
jgi:hypothetical protein